MDHGEPQRITVVTETRNLRTVPFIQSSDPLSTGKQWEDWLEAIEREFRYFRITQAEDKKDALLIYGGKEIARLEKSLKDETVVGIDEYNILRNKLNKYFLPKKNKHHSRYVFSKMKPERDETISCYVTRLRERANDCEFGETTEERILEQCIQSIENKDLIRKAISKGWNLDRFVEESAQIEDTNLQMKDMRIEESNSAVFKVENRRFERQDNRQRKEVETHHQTSRMLCNYCGFRHESRQCPAYGKECRCCGRKNHFESMCRLRNKQENRYEQSQGKRFQKRYRGRVRNTVEDNTCSSDDSDQYEDDYFDQSVKYIAKIGKVKSVSRKSDKLKTVKIHLGDVEMKVEPDSGADVNIMDEHHFSNLRKLSRNKLTLEKSKTVLSTLQNSLPVKGEFKTIVRNATCGMETKFIVIQGRINSPPLLSRSTLQELGMMEIRPDGSFAKPNDMKVTKEKADVMLVTDSGKDEIKQILDEFEGVFDGIGKIRDNKNDSELYVKFNMKPGVAPVVQKPRQVPYYLQKPLKQWLDQGIESDIFEEVPQGTPVQWCSPLVVVPKPKFSKVDQDKLESHMIRACVDLRIPNKFMERNRIIQSPVVEDFIYKFHECKVFSKMDLRQGYHQLMLDPESREVATFSTPWGNMRPKRLIFGAKCSQDLFDEQMQRIFGDIPNCLNQRDDILIGGISTEEHNKTLREVLQRAKDFGITLNKEKCEFGVDELEFYGYKFTKDGLKPTHEKVRAVKEAKAPESKEAVRSFLGMIGYLSKFIPKYSLLTAPLRKLTHKDTKFKWGHEENSAFKQLKDSITNESTMAFFNPTRPIVLRCEASFNEGLSAGLFQQTEKGLQPVHFISRSMSDTEKRYSQTEKDALSIRWAKNRFSIYLLGAPKFKIITAHKPLIPMFNKTTIKLPPRIEKWVMDMQDVDFELLYEPGKDEADPLDFLSRHPLPEKETDGTEKMIKAIIHNEHAVVLDQLQEETEKDKQLVKLKDIIQKSDWERNKKDMNITPYYHLRNELYVAEGLVFRLNQIVVPKTLQEKVIKAAHKMGHFGMTKTKQMLREKYWFPTMNSMVEEIIKKCFECQVTTKQQSKEPLKMTEIPEKPWEVVSVDFGGPYPDGHYNLVVIDKRTRYPEVEKLNTTACKQTKEKLIKIFATHGVPRRLESDNGPPFNSIEFTNFAVEEGFEHHKITPLHPRANGEAEAFMKVLNKTEQIANLQHKDSVLAVQEMLVGYRSTPHPATGVSPYEALMKRQVRTKLGYISRSSSDKQITDDKLINERDKSYKDKIKNQAENRNTKKHDFQISDYVLLEQNKVNKWSTAYEPAFYVVFVINGSTIGARRVTDGRKIYRDASKFKLANQLVRKDTKGTDDGPPAGQARVGAKHTDDGPPALDAELAQVGADWREDILRRTRSCEKDNMNNTNNEQNSKS